MKMKMMMTMMMLLLLLPGPSLMHTCRALHLQRGESDITGKRERGKVLTAAGGRARALCSTQRRRQPQRMMPAMMEMRWTAIDRATVTAGGGDVAGLQQLWLLLLLLLLLMMMMMLITLLVMMAVAKIVATAITMMTKAASTVKGDLSARVGRAEKRGCRSERQRMRIEEGETGPHQHHKMIMLMLLLLLLLLTTTTMLMKKKRPVPTTLELALLPSRCVCACQIETAHRRHRHPTRQQRWQCQRNDERGALAQAKWRLQKLLTPRVATMDRHMRGQTPQPYGCGYAMRNAAPPQPPLRCCPKHLKGNCTTQHLLTTIATQGKNRG
jgi:hypothetical protein